MKNKIITFSLLLCLGIFAVSCGNKNKSATEEQTEDKKAKEMLQGIWINDDDGSVVFRVKGDSVFYPDSSSLPVSFKIFGDSIVFTGSNMVKYPIIRQAQHLFEFLNQNGETVKLVKSSDPTDVYAFENKPSVVLNQRRLIKNDTVITIGKDRYHSYIQINPTTYKVVKTQYNDEGVEVDNVYYDNIVHVGVFKGYSKIFSKDFYKRDFGKLVPKSFLEQSILSEIKFRSVDNALLHYYATLCMPDSPVSYIVDISVSLDGKLKMTIKND